MPKLRRATLEDLPGIVALEEAAFQPWRRSSAGSLRRAITSPHQTTWVLDDGGIVGSLILWHRRLSLRVYGVAIDPSMQGKGLGTVLMDHAIGLARKKHQTVLLEADVSDTRLVAWYEQQGFVKQVRRKDFYAEGKDAWRMVLKT